MVRVVKLDLDAPEPEHVRAPDPRAAGEPRLVLVTWRDAFFDFDQKSPSDTRADYLVHTVGFLIADGPTFLSLAQEVLPDDEGYRAVTHIPRSVVERIELLGTVDEASASSSE